MKNNRALSPCVAVVVGIFTVAILSSWPALGAAKPPSEWTTVKTPPVPELKPVTLDGKTTALLILDMMKSNCSQAPALRRHGTQRQEAPRRGARRRRDVFLQLGRRRKSDAGRHRRPGRSRRRDGEWARPRGPDKYLGSGLDERLNARGIKTVIVCGTSAQGVVIGTGSGSAQRGYKVIVPVDCMSSEDPYMEQYAAWHMFKGGPAIVTSQTTLTRSDMIKF